ncbi:MAG: MBL fold metallo-hydrolase [bacterium]
MKIKFWGVRGSIPTPGPSTVKYGGNTPCIEIRTDDDKLFIVDAGTGIRELGLSLLGKGQIRASIFISHTHWDHIHGFPFFVPAFVPGNEITIYGPTHYNERLEDIVSGQMKYSYFPVKLEHLRAKIEFVELKESTFELDGVKVTARYLHHPILVLGYRFEQGGRSVVTQYDHERYSDVFKGGRESKDELDELLFGGGDEGNGAEAGTIVDELNERVVEFARDADVLIRDAQYTEEEYKTKAGWGHSTVEEAIDVGIKANVKRVVLFHHDPVSDDAELERREEFCARELVKRGKAGSLQVFAAREKWEIEL